MPAGENVVLRGVNWLGDAVMSTPALQRLREAKPGAHITLLTHEKLADLWQGHPSIDAVMTFNSSAGLLGTARRLRAERFDIAVVFPNSIRSALEVFLAGVPVRIGRGGNGRAHLFTHPVPADRDAVRMRKRSRAEIERRIAANLQRETFPLSAHHSHQYLQLVGAMGANPLPVPPLLHVSDAEVANARARFYPGNGSPLFALNPGAEYGPAKRWPAERFIEAAVQLHHEVRCRWVVVGGAADRVVAESIVSEVRKRIPQAAITSIAGQTSLRELCAVLKSCALILTNDTGPMHVAAALGIPVIAPFGSTSSELTGPAFAGNLAHQIIVGDVPCAPCFQRECPIDFRCMKSISVERITVAVRRALPRGR